MSAATLASATLPWDPMWTLPCELAGLPLGLLSDVGMLSGGTHAGTIATPEEPVQGSVTQQQQPDAQHPAAAGGRHWPNMAIHGSAAAQHHSPMAIQMMQMTAPDSSSNNHHRTTCTAAATAGRTPPYQHATAELGRQPIRQGLDADALLGQPLCHTRGAGSMNRRGGGRSSGAGSPQLLTPQRSNAARRRTASDPSACIWRQAGVCA